MSLAYSDYMLSNRITTTLWSSSLQAERKVLHTEYSMQKAATQLMWG